VSLSDRLLALAPRHKEPRVLTIDIETLPGTALYFSRWNVNIGMANVLESPRIGCFAAKWYGKRAIHFHSEHHDGRDGMVRAAGFGVRFLVPLGALERLLAILAARIVALLAFAA
jgi:hypothetical protein